MDRQPRFEKQQEGEHFARRIDHYTGLIDSICLHCFATVCSASDTGINARSEQHHRCGDNENNDGDHSPAPFTDS